MRLLQREGLKPEIISSPHGDEIVIRDPNIPKDKLRMLGFRVADGTRDVRFLLYYEGSYCGVII